MEPSQPFWRTAPPAITENYLERARRGLITPAKIEAELATKGFLPLSVTPDPEKFDPGGEVWWTLAMTAAWIVGRTPDAVREAWWRYRREVRQWVGPQELFVDCEPQLSYGYRRTEKVTGYTLEPLRELDLFGVLLRSTLEQNLETLIVGEAARQSLWRQLESGQLVAEALRSGGFERSPIREADWIDLDRYRQVGWPLTPSECRMKRRPGSLRSEFGACRSLSCGRPKSMNLEVAPKRSTRPQHDRREAIRQAHAALWPDGMPIGLMVKQRDAKIQQRLKADGLLPPAGRTIARALDGSRRGRM